MINIKKCDRCKKDLIEEEFSTHDCHISFKDMENIIIDYYFEAPHNDENGDKVIIAKGLDGIIRRLVLCKHNPPHQPTLNTKNDQSENKQNPNTYTG